MRAFEGEQRPPAADVRAAAVRLGRTRRVGDVGRARRRGEHHGPPGEADPPRADLELTGHAGRGGGRAPTRDVDGSVRVEPRVAGGRRGRGGVRAAAHRETVFDPPAPTLVTRESPAQGMNVPPSRMSSGPHVPRAAARDRSSAVRTSCGFGDGNVTHAGSGASNAVRTPAVSKRRRVDLPAGSFGRDQPGKASGSTESGAVSFVPSEKRPRARPGSRRGQGSAAGAGAGAALGAACAAPVENVARSRAKAAASGRRARDMMIDSVGGARPSGRVRLRRNTSGCPIGSTAWSIRVSRRPRERRGTCRGARRSWRRWARRTRRRAYRPSGVRPPGASAESADHACTDRQR